jgi:hypothetical protein
MSKRSVEIEKLLHWAYRDELVKRHISSAEAIWEGIREYGQRGGEDPGHQSAQRYPHFGSPHPDAEVIEGAVSALPNLPIDWQQSGAAIMGDLILLLQSRDTLLLRTLRTAALVTMHSSMGTRPNWREEAPKPHFVASMKDASKPALVGECKGRNLYTAGSYCPLKYEPSPISIAESRADYTCWHRGLMQLAETLELEDHIALPPAAPAMPWAGEQEAKGKIFAVGERGHQSRLALSPYRRTTLRPPSKPKHSPVRKISA